MPTQTKTNNGPAASRVKQLAALGQSLWLDSISRELMDSGELDRLIGQVGIQGMTSNPTIFEKAINGSQSYDTEIAFLARRGYTPSQIVRVLMVRDIRRACDFFLPVYQTRDGNDGFVSIEVNPLLAHRTEESVGEAKLLHRLVDRPNLLVKIPGTPEGMPAIEELTASGLSINVTLLFSPDAYRECAMSYVRGLERWVQSGGDPGAVRSVASVFVSRIDTLVDNKIGEALPGLPEKDRESLSALLGKAGITNCRIVYDIFREIFYGERFSALRAKGAHVQRPLWASTGTKNPKYSDVMYVDGLVAPETVNTVPAQTLAAYVDHGTVSVAPGMGQDGSLAAESRELFRTLERFGIRMEDVFSRLVADGVKAFDQSFETLTKALEEKARTLVPSGGSAYTLLSGTQEWSGAALSLAESWKSEGVLGRLARKDPSLFSGDRAVVSNRLGWVTVVDEMTRRKDELFEAADEIRDRGITDVVWIGMGGSSLCPQVLSDLFPGPIARLHVLDTTDPEAINRTADRVGLGGEGGSAPSVRIVVASKSGKTREIRALYQFFRSLLEKKGVPDPGPYFWAITDPGTALEEEARTDRFGRIFLNPADIGGRYSALSMFGLVAVAILMGKDGVKAALDKGARAVSESLSGAAPSPGLALGAFLGALWKRGRDKVTLVPSGPFRTFGLWLEQLIAESTGKDGKGLVPVVEFDIRDVADLAASNDRMIVTIDWAEGPDIPLMDRASEWEAKGQPLFAISLPAKDDLFGAFFHWMAAVALAGTVLGIDPFDEPNVSESKANTEKLLTRFETVGQAVWERPSESVTHRPWRTLKDAALYGLHFELPEADKGAGEEVLRSFVEALFRAKRDGGYAAVMAYVTPDEGWERRMFRFKDSLTHRFRIPVTFGFGPRFLHSTGQLHKGGKPVGIFLQITAKDAIDLPIPGEPFSFSVLKRAQQLGDYEALETRKFPIGEIRFSGTRDAQDLLDRLASGWLG
jgi:transaldolase/glucose-6-phosphate isomerase